MSDSPPPPSPPSPGPRIDFTTPLLFDMSTSYTRSPAPFPAYLLSTPQGSRVGSPAEDSSSENSRLLKYLGYEVVTTSRLCGLPLQQAEHVVCMYRERYVREGHPQSRNQSGDALERMSRKALVRYNYHSTAQRLNTMYTDEVLTPPADVQRGERLRRYLHPIPRSQPARLGEIFDRRERLHAWDNVDPEDIYNQARDNSDDELPPLVPPPREADNLFGNAANRNESDQEAGLRRWAANGFVTWFPPVLPTQRPATPLQSIPNSLDEPHIVKIYTAARTRQGECFCEDGEHIDYQDRQIFAFRAEDGTVVVQMSKMELVPMD
ncbi:hypothetical protein R3P38DRAFT_3171505 [Favolaschia claudopus]|uniref:Uncharacterized protein n=1 Tax=Favolaschia claudopus TaxID=2862362 RepID=A0AAW0DU16_9AGAR